MFVLAGLSPGAGALIGGRLHRGFGGAAGEIGALHLLGREATPETLLSTTDQPLHPLDEQQVADVFALAREGDQRARAAVDRFIQRLVHDVAALVLALDPELVVIGGWAAGLDGVLAPLRNELARYCLRPPKVTLSQLGEAAVATGALRLALDHVGGAVVRGGGHRDGTALSRATRTTSCPGPMGPGHDVVRRPWERRWTVVGSRAPGGAVRRRDAPGRGGSPHAGGSEGQAAGVRTVGGDGDRRGAGVGVEAGGDDEDGSTGSRSSSLASSALTEPSSTDCSWPSSSRCCSSRSSARARAGPEGASIAERSGTEDSGCRSARPRRAARG